MIQGIGNPEPERRFREEFVLLAKNIELRVSIQKSCGHKLIEYPDNKRREHRENDVVKRKRP